MTRKTKRFLFRSAVWTCAISFLYGQIQPVRAAFIDVTGGTISGLGAGSGTFTFGGVSGGIATYIISGDLIVNAGDSVSVINNPGNAAINLIVGNDVNVGAGASFDFSASGSSAGPGGGSA